VVRNAAQYSPDRGTAGVKVNRASNEKKESIPGMATTFMQLADTQFGMSAAMSGKSDEQIADYAARGMTVRKVTKFEGMQPETEAFEAAIREANARKVEFVAVCGDLVNDARSERERAEFMRIAGGLEQAIPIYWLSGNHDAAFDTLIPTPESISHYRRHWGDDYFTFQHGDVSFIALNSTVLDHPEQVPGELAAEMRFLRLELERAQKRDAAQIILFTHHPLFLKSPDEPDGYFAVKRAQRMPVVELLQKYRASAVFAGHWHQNNYTEDAGMQMIATGPVGYPLGDDGPGFRIVKVDGEALSHEYHEFAQRG
jgi:serine/threonine-protein phosphatase CPPED1